MTSMRLLAISCALTVTTGVAAQQPAPQKPQPQQPEQAQPQQPQPPSGAATPAAPAPQGYSYDAAGRRDPFVSLLRRGTDSKNAGSRPAGLPGIMIGEVTVKGIVRDRSGFLAMIQGPDSKHTFIIRAGEKLMDGTVKAITPDSVVFSQDVNDPLSMVKQKEIRKTVRPTDGGRG